MPPRSIDFVVVGGGPAGCAFAMLAARAGASVVLIERDDYRQLRPGEHLAGRIRPMLDALRVPKDDASGMAVSSPGIFSTWSGEESLLKLYGATWTGGRTARAAPPLRRAAVPYGARGRRDVMSRGAGRVERLRTREWSVAIADRRAGLAMSSRARSSTPRAMRRRRSRDRERAASTTAISSRSCGGSTRAMLPQRAATMLTVESCAVRLVVALGHCRTRRWSRRSTRASA